MGENYKIELAKRKDSYVLILNTPEAKKLLKLVENTDKAFRDIRNRVGDNITYEEFKDIEDEFNITMRELKDILDFIKEKYKIKRKWRKVKI